MRRAPAPRASALILLCRCIQLIERQVRHRTRKPSVLRLEILPLDLVAHEAAELLAPAENTSPHSPRSTGIVFGPRSGGPPWLNPIGGPLRRGWIKSNFPQRR